MEDEDSRTSKKKWTNETATSDEWFAWLTMASWS